MSELEAQVLGRPCGWVEEEDFEMTRTLFTSPAPVAGEGGWDLFFQSKAQARVTAWRRKEEGSPVFTFRVHGEADVPLQVNGPTARELPSPPCSPIHRSIHHHKLVSAGPPCPPSPRPHPQARIALP